MAKTGVKSCPWSNKRFSCEFISRSPATRIIISTKEKRSAEQLDDRPTKRSCSDVTLRPDGDIIDCLDSPQVCFRLLYGTVNVFDLRCALTVLSSLFSHRDNTRNISTSDGIELGPYSRDLQATDLDLLHAINEAAHLRDTLNSSRTNAEEEFFKMFQEIENLANEIGAAKIEMPRTTKEQTNRANAPANTAEEYYRRAVFVPFFDSFLSQLDVRFLAHKEILQQFSCLTVANVIPTTEQKNQIRELSTTYEDDVNCSPDVAVGELGSWYRYLSTLRDRPTTALDILSVCDQNIHPAIWKLLQVLRTIPVTTVAAERSYSSLRRLKDYLRSTMKEDRLNGLALMFLHRDVPIDADEVFDEIEDFGKVSRKSRDVLRLRTTTNPHPSPPL